MHKFGYFEFLTHFVDLTDGTIDYHRTLHQRIGVLASQTAH